MLGGAQIAQADGSNNRFLINYFVTNTSAGDDVITLVNGNAEVPGVNQKPSATTPDDFVPVCANIFVFDNQQDSLGCCTALISAGGLTRLPVNELVVGVTSGGDPVNPQPNGTIKIVATNASTSAVFVPNPSGPNGFQALVSPIGCTHASSLNGNALIGWTDELGTTFRTHRSLHAWITHSGTTAGAVKYVNEVPFSDGNEPDDDAFDLNGGVCANDVGSCCSIPGVAGSGVTTCD